MKKVLSDEEYYHQEMERMFGKSNREIAKLEAELSIALQRNKDTARELKKDSMQIEKIAKLTGLSIEDIGLL